MKISSTVSPLGSATNDVRTRSSSDAKRGSTASAGDEVSLSPLSSRLQEIQASLSSDAPVDTQRVSEIRQAIAEGRYKINPERIADGLLNSVRDMLTKRA
ncbi:MAG TPA: flagellar biosynthesis anti-sigma factor FlgM [Rhodocyclaceae bacterium]